MSQNRAAFWLYRYSIFVTAMTFLLLLAGGLVTSHEAGLAVPDWPKSYGQWMPPMVGNIFWEHGHRMIAGTVGILTMILTAWIFLVKTTAHVRKWAAAAMAAVLVQAVLGGVTVLLLLPPAVSILHAVLGQTFFCLMIAVAFFLNPRRSERAPAAEPVWVRRAAWLAWLVYFQLFLGAGVRHSGHGVLVHILMALVIVLYTWRTAYRAVMDSRLVPALRRSWLLISAGLALQIFLGLGALVMTQVIQRGYAPSGLEVFYASAHHISGAALLGGAFWQVLRSREGGLES